MLKTSGNILFSINRRNPAGPLVKPAVKWISECYLNQQIKASLVWISDNALKYLYVIGGAGACRHTCRRSNCRSSPHMYMSSRPSICCLFSWKEYPSLLRAGVEVRFQGFTVTPPVCNVQHTDVVFGAGALGSHWRTYVILGHGCSSHRCFRREPSLLVLVLAPHFLKTSLCLLWLFFFCWVLVVFWPHRDPSQITGSMLCFHSEPCEALQSAITAPSRSRPFIIFAAQTLQCSF